jgi:hypothetical protein
LVQPWIKSKTKVSPKTKLEQIFKPKQIKIKKTQKT